MKIPEIKRLCLNNSLEELAKAEEQLLEEQNPTIEVNGTDEGEKLTHLMAAQWCLNDMKKSGKDDLKAAIRAYSQKVRNSIS